MPSGDTKYSKKGMPGLKRSYNVEDSDEDIKMTLAEIPSQRMKVRQ